MRKIDNVFSAEEKAARITIEVPCSASSGGSSFVLTVKGVGRVDVNGVCDRLRAKEEVLSYREAKAATTWS
jgi:hypothetical protein